MGADDIHSLDAADGTELYAIDADGNMTLAGTLTLGGAAVIPGTVTSRGLPEITDPGDAGAIPVTTSGVCHIVTAGAETRTVADAAAAGISIILVFLTDGGDAVVTTASPVNVTGNNTLTMADAGDHIHLISVRDGASAYRWIVSSNDGVALSTV